MLVSFRTVKTVTLPPLPPPATIAVRVRVTYTPSYTYLYAFAIVSRGGDNREGGKKKMKIVFDKKSHQNSRPDNTAQCARGPDPVSTAAAAAAAGTINVAPGTDDISH